jgi:hypothetical protein
MAKIEYALISALYDTKGADLYKEIYYPIVKYSLADMYYEAVEDQKYFDLPALHRHIEKLFGLDIPVIVLRQCAKAVEKENDGVSLRYYEDGQIIKIKEVWELSVNDGIAEKAQAISQRYSQLELMFQQFLQSEHLDCDKTFFDFFNDYAEDAFLFVEQGGAEVKIDENYANLSRFVSWIKDNDTDIYNLINELFWGAVIAGFLRRSNVDLGLKPIDRVNYYLDSSLVFAILGLDSKENVEYAREMLGIIKTAGSIPMVHAITVREIFRIFDQIERQNAPRPGSSIESAMEWQPDLSMSKLLHIRNTLVQALDKGYGIVVGTTPSRELDDIDHRYRNNQKVKKLAKERGNNSSDLFREVHDVYMCELVQNANRIRSTHEKFDKYFVTFNTGLVNSLRTPAGSLGVIHSGNVVINLWIHSSQSTLIKRSGLVEVVARSFAMNKTDVRRRLRTIRKLLANTEYTKEDVQSMYKALVRRSYKTIKDVDALLDKETELKEEERLEMVTAIKEAAVELENEQKKIRLEDAAQMEQLKKDIESTKQELLQVQQCKADAETAIANLNQQIATTTTAHQETEAKMNALKEELEKQRQLNMLTDQLGERKEELRNMEKQRQQSVSTFKFWFFVVIESVLALLLIVFLVFFIIYIFKLPIDEVKKYTEVHLWSIIIGVIALLGISLRFKESNIVSPIKKYKEHIDDQLASWDKRHVEYEKLKDEIESLKSEMSSIKAI